jgi:hypothetical protein
VLARASALHIPTPLMHSSKRVSLLLVIACLYECTTSFFEDSLYAYNKWNTIFYITTGGCAAVQPSTLA